MVAAWSTTTKATTIKKKIKKNPFESLTFFHLSLGEHREFQSIYALYVAIHLLFIYYLEVPGDLQKHQDLSKNKYCTAMYINTT